ncbi:MAG: M15 family metallopeptidase [Proteobacteria bacterium]|nr:M15 family metallopeptidase [Pseudomonadota bacterium]MCP4916946.1 M15 family metallopeptidase [Pseudomonadota bacterium]
MLLALACAVTTDPPTVVGPSGSEDSPPVETVDSKAHSEPATYTSSIQALTAQERERMTGVTWTEGCPVPLDDLSMLRVAHWDFEGGVVEGELVVATSHAADLDGVFEKLFDAGFAIRSMRPTVEYDGSDDASMAADNTSAFNCRAVTGGSSYSEHSYGHAIDINPRENPYVKGSTVLPPEGAEYLDRDADVPGLIHADGAVVEAFTAIGWGWGGNWNSLKDYQHFSATGN